MEVTPAMKQVLVKYCGGCNPEINRSKIVREIKAGLPENIEIITKPTGQTADLGLMVAGCSSNCLDREEIRQLAKHWIIVSGSNVNLFPTDKDLIARRVVKEIIAALSKADETIIDSAHR